MIDCIKYICPADGLEKVTHNISYDITINDAMNWSRHDGTIIASSYAVVTCECGAAHRFLTATTHKSI